MPTPNPLPASLSRRTFLAASAGAASVLPHGIASSAPDAGAAPHQATGVKVGEITPTSAIVWTRLTAGTSRNDAGFKFPGKGEPPAEVPADLPVEKIEGACPGAAGRIRIRYAPRQDLGDARETPWIDVAADGDFTSHVQLKDLAPATAYHYAVETAGPGGEPQHAPLRGRFETAPLEAAPSELTFCVMTCQGYPDRDHADGHEIYTSMLALRPQFVALAGDVVYYDSDQPFAVNAALARLHWERMFSLPRQVELLKNTGTYWLKDDHDTVKNDSWPGNKLGMLSFDEGQRIFRQQTPLSDLGYRTFRWGRDLQIWLTDGRDYRSPNNTPDGPEKTIWGPEQKAWFKRTVKESSATWKVLISPTPLVGPDRGNKNDNHANRGFTHEGDEIRAWLKANVPDNFFVICGDRHWQYHSVHPETGLREFSVGAASDQHAGGSPGEDKTWHQFHRVKGGFLSVTLKAEAGDSSILFEHRDVHGAVVHPWQARRAAG